MATGPPGELGSLAVRISTPSSVTSRVCSVTRLALNQSNPPRIHTELGSQRTVLSGARPVIGPSLVPVGTDTDHRLNGEAHAGLSLSDGLVLRVVGDVGSAVEQLVDTVSAVCPDDTALAALCVLLDNIAVLTEQRAGLDELNSLVQALSRRLRHTYCIWVRQCLVTNVVGLVEVAVEAAVVERHVDVEDIAILEYSLIGNAVADDFVDRGTHRLGEVAVVEG
jgi:hypothetical protein